MLSWGDPNPSRFTATLTFPIEPNWKRNPGIWTPGNTTASTREVYVVCSTTKRGNPQFRFYPLVPDKSKPIPAFVIVKPDHWLTKHKGSHIVYRNDIFFLIRPIQSIYFRAESAIRKEEPCMVDRLVTVLNHAYLCDLVDDSQLDTISRRFERLEKIAARYDGTNFKGEKEIAWSLLVKEAMRTLETIKKEMNHE